MDSSNNNKETKLSDSAEAEAQHTSSISLNPMTWIKSLYDWVLSMAAHPAGIYILFVVAFAESSFFPIPPDVLQIAMSVAQPKRAFLFAFVDTVGSTLGGILGYYIGASLMSTVGQAVVDFYNAQATFDALALQFHEKGMLAVAIAAFTPIPYKIFTIMSGAVGFNLLAFTATSFLARGARFFLVGGLIYFFGEKVRDWIEKYFNILTILLVVALIAAFYVVQIFGQS